MQEDGQEELHICTTKPPEANENLPCSGIMWHHVASMGGLWESKHQSDLRFPTEYEDMQVY